MRSRLVAVACLGMLGLTPLGSGPAAGAAAPADCGSASYGSTAPLASTHYGVDRIQGIRTTCTKAKAIALASEGHGGETYKNNGYRCKPGALVDGIRPYTCTKVKKPASGGVPKVKFRTWGNG